MSQKVTVVTTGDRRIEAVASTEHAAASHGTAVIVIDGEPVGPGDLLPLFESGELVGVEAIAEVEAEGAIAAALEAAGYPVAR